MVYENKQEELVDGPPASVSVNPNTGESCGMMQGDDQVAFLCLFACLSPLPCFRKRLFLLVPPSPSAALLALFPRVCHASFTLFCVDSLCFSASLPTSRSPSLSPLSLWSSDSATARKIRQDGAMFLPNDCGELGKGNNLPPR